MPSAGKELPEPDRRSVRDSVTAGAPLFDLEWEADADWTGGELVIDEVLYFFDEPLMFTVRTGPFVLLVQRWSDDDEACLHTVSLVDEPVLAELRENRLSVRGAVAGDLRFMIDLDGTKVKRVWNVRRWNIPDSRLPGAGACLSDYYAKGGDDLMRVVRRPVGAGLDGVSTFECRQPGFDLATCPTPAAVDALARVVDLLKEGVEPLRKQTEEQD